MADDALRREYDSLRRQVRDQRRAFDRSESGSIVRQLREAMEEYYRMREQGVSREDGCRGLELILRDVFPLSKFPPQCATCGDSGYREMLCWAEQRCGRIGRAVNEYHCAAAPSSFEHTYVVPCECPSGDRFRRRAPREEDALTQVGKMKKRGGFTRLGA